MASYHSSFVYNGEDSFKNRGLIVVAFEPDDGFKETFLSTDIISDDYYDGTKLYTYGSKYNTQATITIVVIKQNGNDFTLQEFRSCAKWLTGARIDSWLDLYNGSEFQYSFLGRVSNLEQYKLDGRTVGLQITFSSVSPWAYSAPQFFDCVIGQMLNVDDEGVLNKSDNSVPPLGCTDGVLYPSHIDENSYFNVSNDRTAYIDTSYKTTINNQSDDLYTYINLDIDYINEDSPDISIKNMTLDEETRVTDLTVNEIVSLSAKQFIVSYGLDNNGNRVQNTNKIFGDSFNFVWPRLAPGINDLVVYGAGKGRAQFTYRYPMKVGDCTMDVSVYGGDIGCCDTLPSSDTIKWENIVDTPTTIGGYGITDAYTTAEVDDKFENIDISGGTCTGDANVNEDELNKMLSDILG